MAAHGRSTVAAILVAAGSGSRLGAEVPKAFVTVGGRSLLAHAVARFAGHAAVDSVVVVAPADRLDEARHLAGVPAVAGGATRQESVAAGLAAIGSADRGADFVLVHDVARPFVPTSVIDAVVEALRAGADAVIPVVPIHDTVRRLDSDGALAGVVDRSTLVAVQTPQGFRRTVLVEAHRRGAELAATDDAGLVEAIGGHVVAVPGADESFKITAPLDLARADALLRAPSVPGGMS